MTSTREDLRAKVDACLAEPAPVVGGLCEKLVDLLEMVDQRQGDSAEYIETGDFERLAARVAASDREIVGLCFRIAGYISGPGPGQRS